MNEETQNSSTEEAKDSTNSKAEETAKTDEKKESKDTKTEEKKYSDKELNDISLKNEKKALAKQLKDLGIDDIEKAKSILAKAKADEEANKSQDEKTKELTQKYDKARLDAINSKIENALLKKGVTETRVARAVRLIDKNEILDNNGEIDLSKLNAEVDNTIKDFPELLPTKEEKKKGFKIGGDGKEETKNQNESLSSIFGNKK